MKNKLVTLMYHNVVRDGTGFSYLLLDQSKFEDQMRFLNENGYNTISLYDLGKPLPNKAVLITFDDGFISVYNRVWHVLEKYKLRAGVFIPTDYMDNPEFEYLGWDKVKELSETGIFSFGAHTFSHSDIRNLDKEGWKREVNTCKAALQEKIGQEINTFCIPYGECTNKNLEEFIRGKDYKYIFTNFFGKWEQNDLEVSIMPRIGVKNEDSIVDFKNKIEGKHDWKGPLQKIKRKVGNLRNNAK